MIVNGHSFYLDSIKFGFPFNTAHSFYHSKVTFRHKTSAEHIFRSTFLKRYDFKASYSGVALHFSPPVKRHSRLFSTNLFISYSFAVCCYVCVCVLIVVNVNSIMNSTCQLKRALCHSCVIISRVRITLFMRFDFSQWLYNNNNSQPRTCSARLFFNLTLNSSIYASIWKRKVSSTQHRHRRRFFQHEH